VAQRREEERQAVQLREQAATQRGGVRQEEPRHVRHRDGVAEAVEGVVAHVRPHAGRKRGERGRRQPEAAQQAQRVRHGHHEAHQLGVVRERPRVERPPQQQRLVRLSRGVQRGQIGGVVSRMRRAGCCCCCVVIARRCGVRVRPTNGEPVCQ
jgi:hypothetical protein